MKPRLILLLILLLGTSIVFADDDPQTSTSENTLPPTEVITPENAHLLQEVGVIGLGEIYDIVYSPSEEYVAVSSGVGLSIFSVDDWSRPLQFFSDTDSPQSVTFTSDNAHIVAYPENQTYWLSPPAGPLVLYNLNTGERTTLIENFTDSVDRVVVDPFGRWIATVEQACQHFFLYSTCGTDDFSENDVRIHIWDMLTAEQLDTIETGAYVKDIEFSPQMSALVYLIQPTEETADYLIFWSLVDKAEQSRWSFEHLKYDQFAISGNGKVVALSHHDAGEFYVQIDLINMQSQQLQNTLNPTYDELEKVGWFTAANYWNFGGRIWINYDATQIFTQEYTDPGVAFLTWDVDTDTNTYSPNDLHIPVDDVALAPHSDESLLYQFNDAIILRQGVMQETVIAGQRYWENAILSKDNHLVAVEGQRYGLEEQMYGHALYDFQSRRRMSLPIDGRPLAISDDSDLIAIATSDALVVWSMELNHELIALPFENAQPISAVIDPQKEFIVVGLHVSGFIYDDQGNIAPENWQAVRMYDLNTGELIAFQVNYASSNKRLALSDDGNILMTDLGILNIDEWVSSNITQYERPDWLVGQSVAMSKTGRYLATLTSADDDWNPLRIIHVYDMELEEEIQVFDAHHGEVIAMAFDPSETLLASASGDPDAEVRDNTVRLWDLETGEEITVVEHQRNDFMRDVAFTSNGKYLMTLRGGCACEGWGFNSAIRIWGVPQRD